MSDKSDWYVPKNKTKNKSKSRKKNLLNTNLQFPLSILITNLNL